MKTIKTISNISYNTDKFFESVIFRLCKQGCIEWAYWIRHKADNDETKDHIHFVLKPSSRIDTSALREQFFELDLNNPSKPLAPTTKWNFTNSIDDWLLYAVHDIGYLASKGQFRNYHYEFEALHSTDEDALMADWNAIDRVKYQRLRILQEAVDSKTPFALLVQDGYIPISQRAQYECQYKALLQLKYDAMTGRRQSHEGNVYIDSQKSVFDAETGELISGVRSDDSIPF